MNPNHPRAVHNLYYNTALTEAGALVYSGPTNVDKIILENNDATDACFVQFFDAAALGDVTIGTTVADWSLRIPGNGGLVLDRGPWKYFRKGLVVAATSTRSNSTAPAADPTVSIVYTK